MIIFRHKSQVLKIMVSHFFSKKVLGILLFLSLFVFSTKSTQAFYTPNSSYQIRFEEAVYKNPDEMNLQSFVYETLKATAGSIVTTITGCLSCSAEERDTGGLLTMASSLFVGIYASPPASTTQYLSYLKKQLGIVQPVYAQENGIGYQAMEKILPAWQAFRNVSYAFFVLLFVIAGFAIMFRVKISPQAVISIQSILPKAILALVLITFSYAIVGLMIDLMYVLIFLINRVFFELFRGSAIFDVYNTLVNVPNFAAELFGAQVPLLFRFMQTQSFVIIIVPMLAFLILIFTLPVVGLIPAIIIAVLVLIAFIRALWTLIKAYAMIIIHLIFAPFEIMLGVLPGSQSIGGWFRNLLANILVFPVMFAMVYLSSYLIFKGIEGFLGTTGDVLKHLMFLATAFILPPVGTIVAVIAELTGQTNFVDLAASLIAGHGFIVMGWQLLSLLLLPMAGLFILLMIPKAAEIVQSFFTGKAFGYGAAIGETFGPIRTTAGLGLIGGTAYYEKQIAQSRGILSLFGRDRQRAADTVRSLGEAIRKNIKL